MAFKLKGCDISIGEHFPKIIQKRRKKKPTISSDEGGKRKAAKAVLLKIKLFIDGRPYYPPANESDDSDAPVPVQGAEGRTDAGGEGILEVAEGDAGLAKDVRRST